MYIYGIKVSMSRLWFVLIFLVKMIRRLRLVNFYYRSLQFHEKCPILSSAFSSSSTSQNRDLKNSKIHNALKQEIMQENKKKFEDTFGNIDSFEQMFDRIKDDPEDILEYQREKAALGKTIGQYIKEIKSHLDNRDYNSALKVLEVDIVNDKKPLNSFVYKVLISYNAKIGNLKEAYRLFINFKRRQGIVTGAMYTSMFNACANCENSFLAIEKANAVAECMRNNKHHAINLSNYNVMIKAYGRHGDLPTCLKIMDEVLEKRDKIKSSTYNFLLQACISDKNSGLRYAIIIWRKMLQNRIRPDIYSFNLLLRCIRECSLGDKLLMPQIIDDIKRESGKFFRRKVVIETVHGEKKRRVMKIPASGDHLIVTEDEKLQSPEENKKVLISTESSQLALEGTQETNKVLHSSDVEMEMEMEMKVDNLGNHLTDLELKNNETDMSLSVNNCSNTKSFVEKSEEHKDIPNVDALLNKSELPNFIALEPSVGSMVEFEVLTKPYHRFMLVGGVKGFLKTMKEFQVNPDVKTFTLMLEVIPSTQESEMELISLAEASKIKLDTGFFNVLIKRRFLRREDVSVKDCLEKMFSLDIRPDLITFGVLALGCNTYELGMDLLNTLRSHGYRANTEILETLLSRADYARDLKYVLAILQVAKEDGTQTSPKFVAKLTKLVNKERYLRKRDAENKLLNSAETPKSASTSVSA